MRSQSSKFQVPSSKPQWAGKSFLDFEVWSFFGIWNLELGIFKT